MTWKERWRRLKARFEALVEEYGWVALGTWFAIFGLTWLGAFAALKAGFQVEGTVAGAGTVGVAYGLTQATKPVRIVATLVLTPLIARFVRRFRRAPAPAATPAAPTVPVEPTRPEGTAP